MLIRMKNKSKSDYHENLVSVCWEHEEKKNYSSVFRAIELRKIRSTFSAWKDLQAWETIFSNKTSSEWWIKLIIFTIDSESSSGHESDIHAHIKTINSIIFFLLFLNWYFCAFIGGIDPSKQRFHKSKLIKKKSTKFREIFSERGKRLTT
jgi:hypothetical protein